MGRPLVPVFRLHVAALIDSVNDTLIGQLDLDRTALTLKGAW